MKRMIIAVVAVTALLTGCGTSGGSGSQPVETQPAGGSSSSSDSGSGESKAADGDWKFAKVTYKRNSALGWAEGTMRATNTTGDERTAVFTVTLLNKSGDIVGTLSGSANTVAGGKTVTVQLVGTDDVTAKQIKSVTDVEVQTDVSY